MIFRRSVSEQLACLVKPNKFRISEKLWTIKFEVLPQLTESANSFEESVGRKYSA